MGFLVCLIHLGARQAQHPNLDGFPRTMTCLVWAIWYLALLCQSHFSLRFGIHQFAMSTDSACKEISGGGGGSYLVEAPILGVSVHHGGSLRKSHGYRNGHQDERWEPSCNVSYQHDLGLHIDSKVISSKCDRILAVAC